MRARSSLSLAKAFEELESIVSAFESGAVDLERDLPKFERGLQLAQYCRKRLREVENRIQTLERRYGEPEAGENEGRSAPGAREP